MTHLMKLEAKQKAKFQFDAIGTHWQIDANISTELRAQISHCVDHYDQIYSRFRSDSIIAEMAHKGGTFALQYSDELLQFYETMYKATNGLVTPLIGQTMTDAGYDATYTLRPKKIIATAPEWSKIMQYTDNTVTLSQPALLDFGAAGKGQLVDIISGIVSREVTEYCVDAGGDIKVAGSLQVGLENPLNVTQVIGVANLNNQSLCGSAGNRRTWGDFHHIINPTTAMSPKHVAAVWTVADSTMLADGIATCLFFTSPAHLLKTFTFEYVMLFTDGSATISPNFPGTLF